MQPKQVAAIIGGGVIGGGWAARFLLHGWDVNLYDPDPEAQRKFEAILANARRSLPGLYNGLLPDEGALQLCPTLNAAVSPATWIQESVPERLDLKQATLAAIQATASPAAVIASSTSGFKPSELAAQVTHPGQILVAHPYNPVYLLPLVELVAHTKRDASITAQAVEITRSIGMHPILLNKEIDAHIGDRLLESIWREALWLIKDDYATTIQIDDIIRFSFGLRWAQMGLFETYRIAGGEAGMAHFIDQFAPALQWPWSHLTNVPELDDALVQKIASQSDQQSGHLSIRDLERQRDNNLVAMLRALKGQNSAAGALLNRLDAQLAPSRAVDWSAPVITADRIVPLDWTDHNGHMNETHYLEVMSRACDHLLELLGCDQAYIAAGHSYFTVENVIQHLDEASAGERVQVRSQIIAGTGKTLHLYHELLRDEAQVIATAEQMLIHVSLQTRRACAPVAPVDSTLDAAATAQANLPRPARLKAGRT
ncbi:MAG: carnitine 3-dehydrogenase [Pseudomonadota bacterium]